MRKIAIGMFALAFAVQTAYGGQTNPDSDYVFFSGRSITLQGTGSLTIGSGGTLTNNGATVLNLLKIESAIQAYSTAASSMTAITPTKLMTLLESTGTITLGATPTISLSTTTYNGYVFLLQCSSENVTLQDNDTLAGSLLELTDSDVSITLTKGDILPLKVDRGAFRQFGQVIRQSGNIATKGSITIGGLTASLPVFTTAGKVLASNAMTGTGSVAMSASPTFTGTVGAAAITATGLVTTSSATVEGLTTLTALTASRAVFTDGSKGLTSNAITGTGNVVMSASPTLTGTVGAEAITATGLVTASSATITGLTTASALTASQAVFTDGSKGLTSNAVTGTGNVAMSASPTFTGTVGAAAVTATGLVTGSSVTAVGQVSGASLSISGGIMNAWDQFVACAAKGASAHAAVEIATTSIVGSTAAPTITQSATPRNVQAIAVFDTDNSTATITASLAIVGFNARGIADTETIVFSTTAVQGNKAWAEITSLTVTVSTFTVGTGATKVTYNLGNHDKLGLSNDVASVDDVIKLKSDTSDEVPTASNISVTYDTYTPASAPNNTRHYDARYKVRSR